MIGRENWTSWMLNRWHNWIITTSYGYYPVKLCPQESFVNILQTHNIPKIPWTCSPLLGDWAISSAIISGIWSENCKIWNNLRCPKRSTSHPQFVAVHRNNYKSTNSCFMIVADRFSGAYSSLCEMESTSTLSKLLFRSRITIALSCLPCRNIWQYQMEGKCRL